MARQTTTYDAVVIGGGCHGTSLTYHLAKHGLRVLLLERDGLASATTGRSSAIVRAHYSVPELVKMAEYSRTVFANFDEVIGGDPHFVQTGYVVLGGPMHREPMATNVAMQRQHGVTVDLLEPPELAELIPEADLEAVAVAAYEPCAGYADGGATCRAFADAAKALGADVQLGVAAERIVTSNRRAIGVETSTGTIATENVAVAAGNWGAQLVAPLGRQLPITFRREAVAAFRRAWSPQVAGVDLVSGLGHWRPDSRVVTLWGGETVPREEIVVGSPDDFRKFASTLEIESYHSAITTRFPQMQSAVPLGGWGGVDDVTPDWNPYLGPIPECAGVYCDFGMSSHFFKHAPAVGAGLADLIATGHTEIFNIDLFRPTRFDDGEPIVSENPYPNSATARDVAGHAANPSL